MKHQLWDVCMHLKKNKQIDLVFREIIDDDEIVTFGKSRTQKQKHHRSKRLGHVTTRNSFIAKKLHPLNELRRNKPCNLVTFMPKLESVVAHNRCHVKKPLQTHYSPNQKGSAPLFCQWWLLNSLNVFTLFTCRILLDGTKKQIKITPHAQTKSLSRLLLKFLIINPSSQIARQNSKNRNRATSHSAC